MNIIESNLQWNGTLNLTNVPQMIVDHHAEASSCTVEDIDRWHKERGWCGFGYHFLVRKDGSIYRGRPENAEGAHCFGYNTISVGICFEGNYMVDDMTGAQKQAGIELHKYLMQKYGINRIEPHRALYNTACPGDKFPFDEIKNASLNTAGSTINYQPISNRLWLQVGDCGQRVTDLQSKLAKLGYTISVDGEYGKETKNAVYKFQADNGLQQDGLAGEQTFAALNNKIEALPVADPRVQQLQQDLNSLFNANLTVDGLTGPCTNAAKEDAKKVFGISSDADLQAAIAQVKAHPLCQRGSSYNYAVRWTQWRVGAGIDGDFGYQTLTLVQNFQAANALAPDGIVGQLTWAAMFR